MMALGVAATLRSKESFTLSFALIGISTFIPANIQPCFQRQLYSDNMPELNSDDIRHP